MTGEQITVGMTVSFVPVRDGKTYKAVVKDVYRSGLNTVACFQDNDKFSGNTLQIFLKDGETTWRLKANNEDFGELKTLKHVK